MSKHKIWIEVVPQIQKELMLSLYNCKATFEMNTSKHTFFILDVTNFTLDGDRSEAMYRIDIYTENNSKSLFIQKDNLLSFTVHFG